MQVTCAACGATTSLDVLLQHEEARAAVAAAMQVSAPLAALLIRYLGLFRPAKRQLTMDRVARLLNELLPHLQAARIERNGKHYAAPVDTWKAALEQMLATREGLRLPLKNHAYLYSVIAGMAERWEAGEEQKVEQARRYAPNAGHREPQGAATPAPAQRNVPGQVMDYLRGFGKGKPVSNEESDHEDGA